MSPFRHSANSSHPCSNDRLDGMMANEPCRDRSPGLLGPRWSPAVCVPRPGAAPVKAKCSLANLWEAESLRHSQLCFRRQCPHFPTELPATSRPEVRPEARTASSTCWEKELSPGQGCLRCLVLSRCQSCWRPSSILQSLPGNQLSRRVRSPSAYTGRVLARHLVSWGHP